MSNTPPEGSKRSPGRKISPIRRRQVTLCIRVEGITTVGNKEEHLTQRISPVRKKVIDVIFGRSIGEPVGKDPITLYSHTGLTQGERGALQLGKYIQVRVELIAIAIDPSGGNSEKVANIKSILQINDAPDFSSK